MSHLGHYGEADIGHEDPPGTFRLLCLSRDIMILFYEALHCCGLLSHLCEPQIGVYVNHTKPEMASGADRIKVGVWKNSPALLGSCHLVSGRLLPLGQIGKFNLLVLLG